MQVSEIKDNSESFIQNLYGFLVGFPSKIGKPKNIE